MAEYALVVEGSPYVYGTAGVTSLASYSDAIPSDVTVQAGMLGALTGTLEERIHPLDGTVSVSALDFTIHDPSLLFAAAHTVDELSAFATFLTEAHTSGTTTLTVDSSSAVGSLPCFLWVGAECVEATAAPTSTTLLVTRARRGTTARALEYDAATAQAVTPGVYTSKHWLAGTRVRLYTVSGTTATLRWLGYVRQGPVAAENGVAWILSCVHAWEHESQLTVAQAQPAGRLAGFDANANAIKFTVRRTDDTAGFYTSARQLGLKARVRVTLAQALDVALNALAKDLRDNGPGVSETRAQVRAEGSEYVCTLYGSGLGDDTQGWVQVGDVEVQSGTPVEAGGRKALIWRIPANVGGALVRAGFIVSSSYDPATVFVPTANFPTGGWAPTTSGGVRLRRMLVADLDDERTLDLDPASAASPGYAAADSSVTDPPMITFRGEARITPRDPATRGTPLSSNILVRRYGIVVTDALPLRVEVVLETEHWLEGLKVLLEDTDYCKTSSDPRNWDWTSLYARVTRSTRGALARIKWRVAGTRTLGDFVPSECAVRGCSLAVRAGKLVVVDVRGANAADTPQHTLTEDDYVPGQPPRFGQWADGLATSVAVESPFRTIVVVDAVARQQYGEQRELSYRSEGLRAEEAALTDPVEFAKLFLGRLTPYARPLYVHTVTVPTAKRATVYVGDDVQFDSWTAPNGAGGRGLTAKRGRVVARIDDLGSGETTLEILALELEYGFAPCARVASIAGAVLTLASAYAGDAGDYAGSGLTGYGGTASDKGATMFAAGDVVELVLRDSATATTEQFTVLSVNGVAGTITLTASVPTVPTDWPALCGSGIVDVRYARFNQLVTAQKVYAAVGDQTAHVIDGTATTNRRWSA